MFNNTKTNVIERNTYVDEYENVTVSSKVEQKVNVSEEERVFNSRISDNFNRIIHYDTYNAQANVQERNQAYEKYSSAVNVDVNPSSTTMQFQGMPKAEIYQDFKVQDSALGQTVVRPRGKLLLFALSVGVCMLSALVIFNTALLKNLDTVIEEKNAVIETLNEEKLALEDVLQDVSNRK